MEELLAPLSAQRAQLEAELSDLQAQEARIRDAIVVLRGRKPGRKPPTAARVGQSPPSQKLKDDIYAVLATSEPLTEVEIAARPEVTVGRSAVGNALRHLRAEERVRVCGKRDRSSLYTVMA